MRWLTNMSDPRLPDAIHYVLCGPNQSPLEALNKQLEFIKNKIIGDPKANEKYTVEQLRDGAKMIGVYVDDYREMKTNWDLDMLSGFTGTVVIKE